MLIGFHMTLSDMVPSLMYSRTREGMPMPPTFTCPGWSWPASIASFTALQAAGVSAPARHRMPDRSGLAWMKLLAFS